MRAVDTRLCEQLTRPGGLPFRAMLAGANIMSMDHDPGATRVNHENRVKLMLAIASGEAADLAYRESPR